MATDPIQASTGSVGNPRGHVILSVCIACGVLETFAVALRFLARSRLSARWQTDDWLIFAALIPNYIMIVLGGYLVGEGKCGMHRSQVTEAQQVMFLKMLWASMLTYIVTVTLVRLSILMLLRRIFEITSFRIVTVVMSVLCVAWGLAIGASNFFSCTPITDAFVPAVVMSGSSKCINLQAMFYGTLGTGFTIDFLILVLPLHQIWKLHLSNRQKLELTAIFSLGGLACVAAILRIVALGDLSRSDLIYSAAGTYVWSQIEPSAAIFCACLVTYRPLFRSMGSLPSFKSRGSKATRSTGVSRRYPTVSGSEGGSEAGLFKQEEMMGFHAKAFADEGPYAG